MIYLDNASTTHKKPLMVYYNVMKTMLLHNGNPGRSGHKIGINAGYEVYTARQEVAELFNGEAERVIFTSGCTESLNLAIQGSVKKGGHIITTAYEHNSVLRVLKHLENEKQITFSIVYPEKNGTYKLEKFREAIKANTYAIIVNHISNVLGIEQDIKGISKIAKEHNLLFIVDSAQSAGHKEIDIKKLNISMLAFAGHKGLLGIAGVGGLILNDKVELNPIKYGGTGLNSESVDPPTSIPESYESGTQALINIVSLKYGIKYIRKHFNKINLRIRNLSEYLIKNLSTMENIILYTPKNCYNGVIAINVKNYSASQVSDILNEKYKICVRSGLQCAPLVHKYLKTLTNGGVIRISIAYYNRKSHIKKLIRALKTLQ